MRLVCPSCSAEYEVDESAIGARGRMVRCASCSSEWFQAPAAGAAAPLAMDPPPPAPEPEAPQTPEPPRARTAEDEARYAALREDLNAPPKSVEPSYRVDPHPEPVVEEEPREQIYFDADPGVVEGAATAVIEETRVRSRNNAAPEDLAASLREDEDPKGAGGAFLAGFATVVLIALIMIAVYVKAPDIAALSPAVEGPVTAYVGAVDKGRMAIAALVNG